MEERERKRQADEHLDLVSEFSIAIQALGFFQ